MKWKIEDTLIATLIVVAIYGIFNLEHKSNVPKVIGMFTNGKAIICHTTHQDYIILNSNYKNVNEYFIPLSNNGKVFKIKYCDALNK